MLTPEQIAANKEALSRGVDETIAKDLGCSPDDDPLGLLVDRELAAAGLLPVEALEQMTPERRALAIGLPNGSTVNIIGDSTVPPGRAELRHGDRVVGVFDVPDTKKRP
jgi:hypothetical protein